MLDLLRRVSRRSPRRLASWVIAAVVASVSILGPSRTALAFCRTTTTPIPANYSPTSGCFTDGLVLFWKGACVSYSPHSAASEGIPLEKATTIIDQAFNTWNRAMCASGAEVGILTSNVGVVDCGEVRYNPNGPNQNVVVFRDDKWPYSDPNNTLGLTTVTFNADTGEIYDADMEINATGKNLSAEDTVPASGFDLLSVITHEAGHFLGLAHATDSKATMFASYKPGTTSLRTLSTDDIAGICEIYPNAKERKVDKSVNGGVIEADACDPTPRHGFGTDCKANPPPTDSGSSGGCALAPAIGDAEAPLGGGLAVACAAVAVAVRRRRCRMV